MFVFVGAAVIVGFAVAGGSGPDGDLPAGTPFTVRLIYQRPDRVVRQPELPALDCVGRG